MKSDTFKADDDLVKDGQYYYVSDEDHTIVYQRNISGDDQVVVATKNTPNIDSNFYAKSYHKKHKLRRLVLFCEMRDCVRRILDKQEQYRDQDIDGLKQAPWEDDQETLLDLYDLFYESFGAINKLQVRVSHYQNRREPTVTRLRPNLRDFREDPDLPLLSALEIYNDDTGEVELSNIFSDRAVSPIGERGDVKNAAEALAVCLNHKGVVDMPYLAEVAGVEVDQIIAELHEEGHIFHDPVNNEWQTSECYLSGNIVEKISCAEKAIETDKKYKRNIEALEGVKPEPLNREDIEISLGVSWLPTEFLHTFAKEIAGAETPTKIQYIQFNHFWSVSGTPSDNNKATVEYGVESHNSLKLLQHCLNNSLITINTADKEGNRIVDTNATLLAREKQDVIKDSFVNWIWEDPVRAEELCDIYNEKFNSVVPPKFNGQHLTLPGASPSITPHGYQLDVAWRNIQTGNTLYAHEVGAGKTFAAAIASMEMKRLGLIKKPCFAVPNHLIGQFSRDFMRLYPNAHILVLDEELFRDGGKKMKVKERLKKFITRSKQYPWDALIIPQSQFDELHVSPEYRIKMAKEDIDECRSQRDATDDKIAKSHLTDLISRREVNLGHLRDVANYEADEEGNLYFDDTGIDYLFIDEGQHYKNLGFHTRIEGLQKTGSAKARRLDEKLFYLRKNYDPKRCLSIMTGTPIANAISEMFIMQKYLQPEMLEEYGIHTFDAWASAFADTVHSVELSPEGGSYRMVSNLARYKNIPELLRIFLMNTDIITTENLNIPKPNLEGGQHKIVAIPQSPELKTYIESLGDRALAVRERRVSMSEDNMLKITVEGRKAALDLSLVNIVVSGKYQEKLDDAADQISQIYHDNKDNIYHDIHGNPEEVTGALQLAFSDLGTPVGKRSSIYHKLKRKLIDKGLPPHSIRFIQQYKTPAKREELFEECRNGKVTVLMGTSEQLGTGTNVQKRLKALHHLDAPWRPDFLKQRDGRAERQGNQNETIHNNRYVTKGSFDIYMWQGLERKARFIEQIMHGDLSVRHFQDPNLRSLSYAEIKAIASENPLLLEKVGVDGEVARLTRLKSAHDAEQKHAERQIINLSEAIPKLEQLVEQIARTEKVIVKWSGKKQPISLIDLSDKEPAAKRGKFLKEKLRRMVKQAKATSDFVTEDLGSIYGFPSYVTADPCLTGLYTPPITITIEDPNGTQLEFWESDLVEKKYKKKSQTSEEFEDKSGSGKETQSLDYLILQRITKPYQTLKEAFKDASDNVGVTKKKLSRYESLLGMPFQHDQELEEQVTKQQTINEQLQAKALKA